MTTPPERFADLAGVVDNDPAEQRLFAQLDALVQPRQAPPEVHAMLDRLLHERIAAASAMQLQAQRSQGTLSRRTAVKAAAASMAFLLALGHTGPALASALSALTQDGPMTGARLAGILQARRDQWNALLAQVGASRMEEPGVEGEWSVKEIVAHLTWYENRIVEGAHQVLVEGMPSPMRSGLAALPMDERNERIAAESRARPLADVLAEADQVFRQLVSLIEMCPDELLNNPHAMGLPGDVVPWMLVAGNSYAHYQEHEQSIRAWLEQTERQAD